MTSFRLLADLSFLLAAGRAEAQQQPEPSGWRLVYAVDSLGDRLWYALLDTTGRLQGYFTGDSTSPASRVATFWYVAGQDAAGPSRLY